jgi:hypothetical protein
MAPTTEKTGQTFAYHLAETGRIRIGHLVPIKEGKNQGKPTPEYLAHFRLTSNSRPALEMAQARYHGTLREWTVRPEWKGTVPAPRHRWELYTEADSLDCIIHPSSLMHSTFERWQGGACVLRCDGQTIIKDAEGTRVGKPCLCPSDPQERKRLAKLKPPEGCDDCSRIAVILEGLKMGKWRLDTGGFYAPAETRGLQALLAECQLDGTLIPAQMRVERRTDQQREQGKTITRHYVCVVIEPRHAVEDLMLAGAQHRFLLPPGLEAEGKTTEQHIADLYGDADKQPAGEDGAVYVARIEAAILAQPGGEIEPWMKWAEGRFKKPRTAFTVNDYANFLQAIIATAELRAQKTRAEAQGSPGETALSQQESAASPDTQEGTAGASWGPENPELFTQEERADEYGA